MGKKHKFIEPILIKAGSDLLGIGYLRLSPKVDCRLIAEEGYQYLKKMHGSRVSAKIVNHDAKIELLESYSKYLEENGFMDTDWRAEEPYAIDEFLNKK